MITRIYVGVDISKNWFDVCTSLDENAPVVRYSNNPDGHAKFTQAVSALAEKVHVCMEYTGGYETPVALACKQANLVVSLIDGGNFSDYRKSHGRAKAKTDQQDARLLARFASQRKLAEWFPVPQEYGTLRDLVRHRESLICARAAWACRAAQRVENAFVTAQKKAIVEVFTLQIEELDKQITACIKAHSSLKESLDLLVSIPGIAQASAARIIAETGPIANYRSAREYAMAAGLSPIVIHSGQKTPPGKLPVYGNADLRCALYFPCVCSTSHKIGVWKFMERVNSRGNKHKMTVITAGMRKLAHVIYGVLSSKSIYDPSKI